jgi:anti-sigma regulatory factor (Ser/Thr protein kinase)
VHVTLDLPAEPRSVIEARRALDRLLDEQGVAEDRATDIRLVLSELVSNAVKHGSKPGDEVAVDLEAGPEMIEISVSDAARGSAPRVLSGDHRRRSGRGLLLVERLAEEWGDTVRGGRRIVWCRVPI